MSRVTNRLSARGVASLKGSGGHERHADGGGLYLHIETPGMRLVEALPYLSADEARPKAKPKTRLRPK